MTEDREPSHAIALRAWAESHGAYMHPALYFKQDAGGMAVFARTALAPDTVVLTAPFGLAITPAVARRALDTLFGELSDQTLSDRELVNCYVALHWVAHEIGEPVDDVLAHRPYVDALPDRSMLRTPLHFTPEEKQLLLGTNMAAATTEREESWRAEYERCRAVVERKPVWGRGFTWEHYLTAATHLSSRAFPSTLLSATPTLLAGPESHPVLLPLIDSLNHARAHPVSWTISGPYDTLSISVVQLGPTPADGEVLNNYGAKPNAELVLGYGFALANNPDDTLVLKLAGAPRREIGGVGAGVQSVWEDAYNALCSAAGLSEEELARDEETRLGIQYGAARTLEDLLSQRVQTLPRLPREASAALRPDVLTMLQHYVAGQHRILGDAIAWAHEKADSLLKQGADIGIDLADEDDDDYL